MKQPIRILHFVPVYGIGGIESLIMSLYRHIDKSKIQFDLLVETQAWHPDFEKLVQAGGWIYQLMPFNKKNPFIFIREIKKFFQNNTREYAVLHSHVITRSAPILYYAKKAGITRRISHAHTDCLDGNRFVWFSEQLMRLNNRLSTHYLASPQQAGAYYFNKDKKPFTVLKNTIDTKQFSFNPNRKTKIRKSLALENCFVIGHIRRFTYQKNHWKILDVFYEIHQQLPSARLLLVGDGALLKVMRQKAEKLNLKESAIFLGNQNDEESLLSAMDIFVFPSTNEGLGIVAIETQASGLPCLVSDTFTPEVKITNWIEYSALKKGAEYWASEIRSSQKTEIRDTAYLEVKKAGYDIKESTELLKDFYLSCYTC